MQGIAPAGRHPATGLTTSMFWLPNPLERPTEEACEEAVPGGSQCSQASTLLLMVWGCWGSERCSMLAPAEPSKSTL